MRQPETIRTLKLAVAICAVALLLNAVSGRRWVAAVETATFRLSLSLSHGEAVRFRTGLFESGQSGLTLVFESRR